jgi:uncharacterized protein YihD (DUF1040 family)
MDSINYNLGNIRKLLEEALTDQQFYDLLQDKFLYIYDNFKDRKIPEIRRELVDYAKKQRKIQVLLDEIKEKNEAAYEEHRDKLIQLEIPSLSNLKDTILDGKLIDELGELLPKGDEIFWQCAQYVYQDFLLFIDTESDSLEEIVNLDELLWQLKDKTDELVILGFVARLIAYIAVKYAGRYEVILSSLKSWTRQNIIQLKINRSDYDRALSRFKRDYQRDFNQAYLMIAIAEKAAYPNLFQISGWLATDAILSNPDLDLIPLEIQNLGVTINGAESQEGLYTLEDLKEITRDFKIQVARSCNQIENLIIEFFLPSSLIYLDVENWENDPSTQICLGSVHEVRIRSLDRQNLKYRHHIQKWKNKWKVVRKCNRPLNHFLSSHSTCDANILTGQLQKKVGLKLKSSIKSGHTGILSALYYTGTPIALWFRSDPPGGDCEATLDRLLQEHLLHLPNLVFNERCDHQHHLSLIWDDPNRLTPTYEQLQ